MIPVSPPPRPVPRTNQPGFTPPSRTSRFAAVREQGIKLSLKLRQIRGLMSRDSREIGSASCPSTVGPGGYRSALCEASRTCLRSQEPPRNIHHDRRHFGAARPGPALQVGGKNRQRYAGNSRWSRGRLAQGSIKARQPSRLYRKALRREGAGLSDLPLYRNKLSKTGDFDAHLVSTGVFLHR